MDPVATWLTFRLAAATTVILVCLGLPAANWLACSRWKGKYIIEALLGLPLVLPPTVLGFYLLVALGPRSVAGHWYASLTGSRLPFTFEGILLGSVIANIPFAVRPFTAAIAAVDRRYVEAAWCLGVSRLQTFWRVVIPLAWPGILTGVILTFAHTVGEFGVVLMLGGSIPGVTRTLSIAIYDDVQALNYESAARTALFLTVLAFAVLSLTSIFQRRVPKL